MNRLLLSAQLVERSAMRYTPAGLPALDVGLRHESEQAEDGSPRRVSVELSAVAIGRVTSSLAALPMGETACFAGFVAAARNGRGIRFHITSIEPAGGLDRPNPVQSYQEIHHAPTPR